MENGKNKTEEMKELGEMINDNCIELNDHLKIAQVKLSNAQNSYFGGAVNKSIDDTDPETQQDKLIKAFTDMQVFITDVELFLKLL